MNTNTHCTSGRASRGFTLIELLVVMAQIVLCDGSVHFLAENIDQGTLRRLCDPSDETVIGEF